MKKYFFLIICIFTSVLLLCSVSSAKIHRSPRSIEAVRSVNALLTRELSEKGLEYGAPIFIRIFKKTKQLEVWVQSDSGKFELFKKYNICFFSGGLGPKTKDGDLKTPEGFYFVSQSSLNPRSRYYLSFNIGYPNAYDRYHKRTGDEIMIHGKCVSIGCFAMTDDKICEIYALAQAALENGQPFFRVHIFPFEMITENLKAYQKNKWFSFWKNLKDGYWFFERNKLPPNVEVMNGVYVFN
jgi:murein L,D-transpeptidase YafK